MSRHLKGPANLWQNIQTMLPGYIQNQETRNIRRLPLAHQVPSDQCHSCGAKQPYPPECIKINHDELQNYELQLVKQQTWLCNAIS